MEKLYTVVVETELVILAESANDAEQSAIRIISGSDYDPEAFDVSPAVEMKRLPPGYNLNCLPWLSEEVEDEHDPEWTINDWIINGAAPLFIG
jgi:hypothetical protein